MIAPNQDYHNARTEPSSVLPHLRELFSRDPLLLDAGIETLAYRLGVPVWAVELAQEALLLEGEVAA